MLWSCKIQNDNNCSKVPHGFLVDARERFGNLFLRSETQGLYVKYEPPVV